MLCPKVRSLIDWYQNVLDFEIIGKILDLLRGKKFFEHCAVVNMGVIKLTP